MRASSPLRVALSIGKTILSHMYLHWPTTVHNTSLSQTTAGELGGFPTMSIKERDSTHLFTQYLKESHKIFLATCFLLWSSRGGTWAVCCSSKISLSSQQILPRPICLGYLSAGFPGLSRMLCAVKVDDLSTWLGFGNCEQCRQLSCAWTSRYTSNGRHNIVAQILKWSKQIM